ncbi:MAG TPA: hypothetical protein VHD32_05905 [Candidatus Didemnitutus sp.]|nr:hypothetical protein [Candidatus Didemnitutus sp.]
MRTILLALLSSLAAAVAWARTPAEFPGLDENWSRYESPHFELYSAISESTSRGLLEQLEMLRAVLMARMKLTEVQPVPVTLFCYKSQSDFENCLPAEDHDHERTVSFWSNQSDRCIMLIAPGESEELRNFAGLQFVEYLFTISDRKPARWYLTGLCQLYGNADLGRKSVELGVGIPGWATDLRLHGLFPLDRFFGFDNGSQTLQGATSLTTYCAQAWLLMHYCEFGRRTLPKEKLQAFLAAVSDERMQRDFEGMRRACRETLGCDYPELQEDLHKYLLRGEFPSIDVPRPDLEPRSSYARRPAPAAEMRARLAEVVFRLDRSPRGRLALLQALDHEPVEARVYEVLGNDGAMHGDEKEARERWAQALEAKSGNPAVIRTYADLEVRRWFRGFDLYFQLPPARAEEYRELLHRSLRLAPRQTGAYELLAWVESSAPSPDAANVAEIERQLPTLQHPAQIQIALALVHFHARDYAGVRARLAALEAMHPDAAEQKAAGILLAETARREAEPVTDADRAGSN